MTNMHSERFLLVKGYYDGGFWQKNAIKNAVILEWITAEEYFEITGEVYS